MSVTRIALTLIVFANVGKSNAGPQHEVTFHCVQATARKVVHRFLTGASLESTAEQIRSEYGDSTEEQIKKEFGL